MLDNQGWQALYHVSDRTVDNRPNGKIAIGFSSRTRARITAPVEAFAAGITISQIA